MEYKVIRIDSTSKENLERTKSYGWDDFSSFEIVNKGKSKNKYEKGYVYQDNPNLVGYSVCHTITGDILNEYAKQGWRVSKVISDNIFLLEREEGWENIKV